MIESLMQNLTNLFLPGYIRKLLPFKVESNMVHWQSNRAKDMHLAQIQYL